VVLGRGKPFFAGPRSPLGLVASDRIGEDVIRLTNVPHPQRIVLMPRIRLAPNLAEATRRLANALRPSDGEFAAVRIKGNLERF
jgi:hypothetical protein